MPPRENSDPLTESEWMRVTLDIPPEAWNGGVADEIQALCDRHGIRVVKVEKHEPEKTDARSRNRR